LTSEEVEKGDGEDDAENPKNKKSKLNFIRGILPYFDSEWSYARFKMPGDDHSK
jgi:hypothetical protein